MAAESGWIVHKPYQNLEKFIDDHKPSTITDPHLFWVSVTNPHDHKARPPLDETYVQSLWQQLQQEAEAVNAEDIKAIASATGYTSGKWMVFRKSSQIDDVWATIARATVEGKLGLSSKVSTRGAACNSSGQEHVVCVFTADFTDYQDVTRVENELRKLGITGQISYKPDIYTHCGIYFRNPWNIKPTLFTTHG